jgi:hypothetical protein
MSVRRTVVRPAGIDDLMDDVRAYEESELLADRQKAALRFTDSFLANPLGLDAAARSQLLEHFDDAQIVELIFKLMYWSCNKPLVACGMDGVASPEGLTDFHYDEHGAFIVHR